MTRICSIMYTMYEIEYGILTKIVSGYLQDSDEHHWKVILSISSDSVMENLT